MTSSPTWEKKAHAPSALVVVALALVYLQDRGEIEGRFATEIRVKVRFLSSTQRGAGRRPRRTKMKQRSLDEKTQRKPGVEPWTTFFLSQGKQSNGQCGVRPSFHRFAHGTDHGCARINRPHLASPCRRLTIFRQEKGWEKVTV